MRAALVILLVVATGFDHATHDAATSDALTCTQCHRTTKTGVLAGAPGHAACFGRCHGAAPKLPPRGRKLVVEPARAAVCRTCHTQSALDAGTRAALVVRTAPSPFEFQLAIGHKRHAAVACAQCHAPKRSTPHARCASCHVGAAGKGPPMSLCTSCHLRADPQQVAPDARPVVRSAFSHEKHAARGTTGAQCATCHPTASETDARELPHANAQMCAIAGCHDDAAAFGITASCTRCHQDVPAGKYEVARPTAPFSHASHLAYTAFVACTTCHAVAPSGEVGLAGHAQCAPCHAEDFGRRDPVTCGACHDATEPWRKLIPDRPSLPRSEFGASLDHDKHPAACTNCHKLTTASAQLRPPRGHVACSGRGCHARTSGPAPSFTRCDGCHELGLEARREEQRARAPWSVRQRFMHAKHERAPDGNPLACTACHVDTSGRDLLSIATPAKSACVACHDGQTAFKVTGTGCARCHPSK